MISGKYIDTADIGKRIEHYRVHARMSRKELADAMNVAVQSIYRWEKGERLPDVVMFVLLAKTLGVNLEALINLPPDD